MQWLNNVIDEATKIHPDGEIVVSSGVSPSGKYHLGTLREVMTAEVIARELKNRGRKSRHIHVVDDLDVFRKVPSGVSEAFKKQLGKPLCDVPSPDGSSQSYADYFLADLVSASKALKLDMEIIRSHEEYQAGFFTKAVEKTLDNIVQIRKIIEEVSHRKLDDQWSPVQVMEDGYLKTRKFLNIDKESKTIICEDKNAVEQSKNYQNGDVKLNWRIDWPARWWLMGVDVEPFGRDHATKGGSYDTGKAIARDSFGIEAPLPVPYHFINRTGETKKMSKSSGDTINITELLDLLPPEIIWYFMLRMAPSKQLFFDEGPALMRLFDDFSELMAKPDKSASDKQLISLCMQGIEEPTVSNIPFTHLVACYQASLKDTDKTLELISKTEHARTVGTEKDVIKKELKFISNWLDKWAPEDIKFELQDEVVASKFNDQQKKFMADLAANIKVAPKTADGEWFHKTIYDLKDTCGLEPKQMFQTLYQALIGKDSGPRAGWFLSILPRDWLINRLQLLQ